MTATVLDVVSAAPHPRLRRLVSQYHGYAERAPGPVARPELPHAGITIVVDLAAGLTIDGERHRSFAAGLYDRPVLTEHAGEQAGLQLYVAPPAARMLLGIPLGELADRTVALEDLLGRTALELLERLHGLPTWRERFALMDAVVARRISAAAPVAPAVLHAWARIVATGGRVPAGTLAAETGWSRRHLAARFRHEIGLAPKAYARVVRFGGAVTALREGGEPRLAAVAAGAGFADQPHLNREFRALAGTTPAAVARSFAT